jgi:D-aminoacyl-tRNA deacylase
MRALVQRVRRAEVHLVAPHPAPREQAGGGSSDLLGLIGTGMVVLLGVGTEDTAEDATGLAVRLAHLRIFDDDAGRLNRSILDIGGDVLSVPQFTLYADTSGGRRPSFVRAAPPERAEPLYLEFNRALEALGVRVVPGRFRTHMVVEIHNDGPVTILLDSRER